jgi:transcriptional regulator with XRE-family HTH domain
METPERSWKRDTMTQLTAKRIFGKFLRLSRTNANLTQQQLADICNCAKSEISKIEGGRTRAPHNVIERADKATNANGELIEMYHDLPWEEIKEGFQEYRRYEEKATRIRTYEPTIIHGLLQTHAYARAIFTAGKPNAKPDVIDDLVSSRMDRQEIFAGDCPAELLLIIDEGALHRHLGGAEAHGAQLDALIDAAQRPEVIIRIIPGGTPLSAGLSASFTVLDLDDAPSVAYAEDPVTGRVTDDPDRVAGYVAEFEAISTYALPVEASLELIRRVRGER